MTIGCKGIYLLYSFLLLGIFSSCVKDVDFEQGEDFKLEPVYELNFVYSRITAPKFTNPFDDSFRNTLDDILEDDFFTGDIGENLLRAELFIALENTIPAGFDAELSFLDENNQVIPISSSPLSVRVEAGTRDTPIEVDQMFLFTQEDLLLLNGATKIRSSVVIDGNDNTLGGELILKSRAVYYTTLIDEE